MLRAEHLAKRFLQGESWIEALQDFSYDFPPGITAIVGASGSGKTTLLNLLAGFLLPSEGKIYLDQTCLSDLDEDQRAEQRLAHMGFIFQSYFLIPTLTALENVAFPLLLAKLSESERSRRAAEALARVGLAQRASHLPSRLSGGEQQRVAVARALVNGPEIIFADEPTGNLDSASGELVIKFLFESRPAGSSLIMVTHDLSLAARAERTLTLRDGRLVADSATSQVQ
jgi:putative ABC transport system ATP-binding protein